MKSISSAHTLKKMLSSETTLLAETEMIINSVIKQAAGYKNLTLLLPLYKYEIVKIFVFAFTVRDLWTNL